MNAAQPQPNLPTETDLELLSAYLDNQLSVAERVSLEQRLRAEPLLRTELAELRATTELLRNLEPVRPPRSFTLDPATAPRRVRVNPFAWAMQLGSGLAGLALVLIASLQLLVTPVAAPAQFESSAAPMAQEDAAMGAAAMPEATMAAADTMRTEILESAPAAAASDEAPSDAILAAPAAPPLAEDPNANAPDTMAPAAEDPVAAKVIPEPAFGLPSVLILGIGIVLLIIGGVSYLAAQRQR